MELFIIGFGEIFRKDKSEIIEYGYIVYMGEDGLVHKVSKEEDLNAVIGICSNTVGMEMAGDAQNLPEEEKIEVEMMGKIWVKSNDTSIKAGCMVKALADGTIEKTLNKVERFGVAMTSNIEGKVRIVYNG